MDFLLLTRILAWIGLAAGLVGIGLRLNEILHRPFKRDLARPRGSAWRGVLYAFTLGMAPWEKESTRIHWVAYLRGIFFHLGIFAAFFVLLILLWLQWSHWPAWLAWPLIGFTGLGAIFGFAGLPMRWLEPNSRSLSLPDDYASVALTSLFIALSTLVIFFTGLLPVYFLVAMVLGIYIPYSKIRHCVYFFYSKFFFGLGFGRRGVIGTAHHE